MTPSLPHRSFIVLAAAALAMAMLAGCEKNADEDDGPSVAAAATPTPAPVGSERTGRKALSAYNAVNEYLKGQDPGLSERFQKAAAKFVDDKDKWRERLKARQHELQARAAHLRDQLTKADGKSADALKALQQELSNLESQGADADRKLSELESITSETWKSFRDRLASDDDAVATPKPGKR